MEERLHELARTVIKRTNLDMDEATYISVLTEICSTLFEQSTQPYSEKLPQQADRLED